MNAAFKWDFQVPINQNSFFSSFLCQNPWAVLTSRQADPLLCKKSRLVKSPKIIIAIDGYSSCGKSTPQSFSQKPGYSYIDSGAMYRAVTLFIQQHDITLEQLAAMTEKQMAGLMDNIHIGFMNPNTGLSEVFLNGLNVETRIRGSESFWLGKSG